METWPARAPHPFRPVSIPMTDRRLAFLILCLALSLLPLMMLYQSIQNGTFWQVALSMVGLLIVILGSAWIISIILVKIYTARGKYITDVVRSSISQATKDGQQVIAHHPMVKITVIKPYSERELPAPVAPVTAQISGPDPMDKKIARLVAATIEHPDYGPSSGQLISAPDAAKVGISNGEWHQIVKAMSDRWSGIVRTQGSTGGTWLPKGMTVTNLLEDLAH